MFVNNIMELFRLIVVKHYKYFEPDPFLSILYLNISFNFELLSNHYLMKFRLIQKF